MCSRCVIVSVVMNWSLDFADCAEESVHASLCIIVSVVINLTLVIVLRKSVQSVCDCGVSFDQLDFSHCAKEKCVVCV